MSIEAAIGNLTKALEENNRLLSILTAKAKPAVEAPAKAKREEPAEEEDEGDEDEAPAKAKAKAEEPAEEAPKRGRGRPRKNAEADAEPAPAKPAKGEKVTAKTLTAEAEAFLDVEDDAEYAERRKTVRSIVRHFGVGKIVEIEEGDRAEALAFLRKAAKGEALDFDV